MSRKGFTLIELLVVVAIIGLLSSIVFASLNSARNRGKDAAARTQMRAVQGQAALYYSDNGTYSGMWNAGTAVNTQYTNLIAIEDNQGARGVGAVGDYYYAAVLLKNGNMLCLDATNMKEVTYVGWNYPGAVGALYYPLLLCP